MKIDPELLEILVCPACRAAVRAPEDTVLVCGDCGRRFPVRDGIPVMLAEEPAVPDVSGEE